MATFSEGIVTIIRHGEGLHNVSTPQDYIFLDPPLTARGLSDAHQLSLSPPDLIIISPMSRTIQTVISAFGPLILGPEPQVKVQIWPELREAENHLVCKGSSKAEMKAKFPNLAFSGFHDEWDYPSHTTEGAVARGEEMRGMLRYLAGVCRHIVLVTHRGFAAFLVQDPRFKTCDM